MRWCGLSGYAAAKVFAASLLEVQGSVGVDGAWMVTAQQCKRKTHVKRSAHEAKRGTKLEYRTVVLEVLSRLPRRDRSSHSRVEDLS